MVEVHVGRVRDGCEAAELIGRTPPAIAAAN